jgi:VanZ family protein
LRTVGRDPHLLFYWLPPIIWGLAILAMSGDVASSKNTYGLLQWLLAWFVTLKAAEIATINVYLRKTGHVLAYGLMYFLWFRAFRGHLNVGPGRAFLYALGLCFLVSATDEGHQSFTRFRGGSIYDVLLDCSAAGLAGLITFAAWTPPGKAGAAVKPSNGQTAGPG